MPLEISAPLSLFILVADIVALVGIGRSSADKTTKLIWIFVVLLLPVLGFIAWLFAGPRALPRPDQLVKPK